jgi:hypothetical protein
MKDTWKMLGQVGFVAEQFKGNAFNVLIKEQKFCILIKFPDKLINPAANPPSSGKCTTTTRN